MTPIHLRQSTFTPFIFVLCTIKKVGVPFTVQLFSRVIKYKYIDNNGD